MSIRSIVISSEHGRREIRYGEFAVGEMERRVGEYERKYGVSFEDYAPRVSCDTMRPYEMEDFMDWENLVEELALRRGSRDRVDAIQ